MSSPPLTPAAPRPEPPDEGPRRHEGRIARLTLAEKIVALVAGLVVLAGAVITLFNAFSDDTEAMPFKIEFVEPKAGKAQWEEPVRLRVTGKIPDGHTIWLWGRKMEQNTPYFPHHDPVQVDVDGDGTAPPLQVGDKDQTGKTYEFYATLADKATLQEIENYELQAKATQTWTGFTTLPGTCSTIWAKVRLSR